MIKELEIDGQKMTAVVLGDSWSNDPEQYRNSLLDVIENSALSQDGMTDGPALVDCIRLARALEQKPVLQKGGEL